jgi:hypothetical protein
MLPVRPCMSRPGQKMTIDTKGMHSLQFIAYCLSGQANNVWKLKVKAADMFESLQIGPIIAQVHRNDRNFE